MFVHLHVHSMYSMLDGSSRLEDLLARTAADGASSLALTDHDSIAGLVFFRKMAKSYGVHPISGVELTLAGMGQLVLLAQNEQGYENICRLLTAAYAKDRLAPRTGDVDLRRHTQGLIALTGGRFSDISGHLLRREYRQAQERLCFYRECFGANLYMALSRTGLPGDLSLTRELMDVANRTDLPVVATNDVHYADKEAFPVHDTLICIREKTTVDELHPARPLNRENDLKSGAEMLALFADCPESIANTQRIAACCESVPRLEVTQFPAFPVPAPYASGAQMMQELVSQGAMHRYGRVDAALRARLDHELRIITELGYVDYFLVVWDIAAFARKQGIRYAGRGSAADSAVAFCLYITDVDAAGRNLLFERFMSLERAEKPDIDIDFESSRRDEIKRYVYETYGFDHVASVCTYSTFRGRSAVREIGKALGLPEQFCDQVAKRIPYMLHADQLEEALLRFPELRALDVPRERLQLLLQLSVHLAGFPRHLGMHVGGVVISRRPLLCVASLQPSAKGDLILPFDKDAVEDLGLVKLDLLSLRTMSAIEDTIQQAKRGGRPFDYDSIPLADQDTFRMIASGETIGVFQLESPAQRALQARLNASSLEDIVASVALIRPGPIKGNMVDPFLARRKGHEVPTYLHPKLEPILSKTYGVVLFQEQVIEIATAIADFTPGEADRLRRVMSHARSAREMDQIGREFVAKAVACDVGQEVAETIFSYIRGYASYGFCEAHAAAFATTAYKTAYLVRHYPAAFFASIINAQPMGFYPLHMLIAEVRRRGVRVLGVDVNESRTWAEGEQARLRVGFMQVLGMRKDVADAIERERQEKGSYTSLDDFCTRIKKIDRLQLERLIRVGAFDVLLPNRRALLWALPGMLRQANRAHEEGLLFESAHLPGAISSMGAWEKSDGGIGVEDFRAQERLAAEYHILGFGVTGHWLSLYRDGLTRGGCSVIGEALAMREEVVVTVAGLVIRPHRPPTRSGKTVVFFTLEDETGMIDVTVFQDVYQRDGAALFDPHRGIIIVRGVLQRRQGGMPQIVARMVRPHN